jgi:autotransporter-associated beta strand protein
MKNNSYSHCKHLRWPRLSAGFAGIVLVGAALLNSPSVKAGSAAWNLDPINHDWNTRLNWTPNTVPLKSKDIATLGVSHVTDVTMSAFVGIAGITFTPGASAYHLSVDCFIDTGVVNDSGVMQYMETNAISGSNISFNLRATAGNDVIYTINAGSYSNFSDTSTAGNSTFIINGPDGEKPGATVYFNHGSSASESTIILNAGASAYFDEHTTAANAALIIDGGDLHFRDNARGDLAQVQLSDGGVLEVLDHVQTLLSLGSLEGDGIVDLATAGLIIGSNGLDREFSGVVQEEGEPRNAVLTKVGSGALTFSGENLYTGGTVVEEGMLLVKTQRGSATGPGPVQVVAGTLGGRSNLSGAVTIGSGSGPGAYLAPGIKGAGVLVIRNQLTFKADGHYNWELNLSRGNSDEVIAKGVTIESGAQFDYTAVGHQTLAAGTTFTVIDNRSRQPTSGTFTNLPEGAILNISGNTLQASYQGGDGNDLTLTVVP